MVTRLSELGIEAHHLDTLAEDASKQWTATFNPTPVQSSDLLEIYERRSDSRLYFLLPVKRTQPSCLELFPREIDDRIGLDADGNVRSGGNHADAMARLTPA